MISGRSRLCFKIMSEDIYANYSKFDRSESDIDGEIRTGITIASFNLALSMPGLYSSDIFLNF